MPEKLRGQWIDIEDGDGGFQGYLALPPAGRAEVFVYPGASHGFNCWDRASYDPASAALAHGRTLAFLAQQLYPANPQ